uniref:uncharacterized protein LOC118154003 n=1 Tax=Callithrix jacchus TaxID=9483 RepID=UPI0023DD3D75|nr:uncharacterized protein LOC118154003 [Callithrix jacchus]
MRTRKDILLLHTPGFSLCPGSMNALPVPMPQHSHNSLFHFYFPCSPRRRPRPRPTAPRTEVFGPAPAAHLRQVLLLEKIRLAVLEAVLTLALLEDIGPEFPARLLLGRRHSRRRGSSSQAGAELPAGLGLSAAAAASLADPAAGPAQPPPRRLAARAEAPAPSGSHSAHNSPRPPAQPRPDAAGPWTRPRACCLRSPLRRDSPQAQLIRVAAETLDAKQQLQLATEHPTHCTERGRRLRSREVIAGSVSRDD